MELGLTLGRIRRGDYTSAVPELSSTPFNKSTNLALALGVCSGETHHQHEGSRSNADRRVSVDYPRLDLDLLPLWSPHETPSAAVDEAEAASSPNSMASSFPVDFYTFRGEKKRDTSEVAARCGGEQRRERTTSRASEEDVNGHCRRKLRLSKEQAAFLEESFKEHNTLNTKQEQKQKQAIAKQLNLRPRQVEVWFQNRRARTKLKQMEVDCECLKRCCETLTQENRRLHKEIQELRVLKSSNPFYMQLPATTLTMCPSCKCTNTTNTVTTSSENAAASPSTIASNNTADPSSIVPPFPLTGPNFFPFSSHNSRPQKSVAS